jgi:MoaA/NifB/PqqE/SkfB family radical SAM enzyme
MKKNKENAEMCSEEVLMRSNAYNLMREKLVKVAKERKVPLLGHFELTARCNLDCKMCYVHTQNNAEILKKELTTEQWKKIFDEAYECEMLYAHLTGGECLIRKDFKELYMHLWNKQVRIHIQTNGTLLNEDYVEFFKTYRPDQVRISLYGNSEDTYLNVAGHKGFEKAVAAIRSLQDAGIDVAVCVTPSKYMLNEYVDVLRFCKEQGFNVLDSDVTLLPPRDNPEKNDYFLTDEESIALSIEKARLRKELVPVKNTPEPFGPMTEKPARGLTCNAGNCLAAVSWDGKMHPCLNVMVGGADVLELGYAEAWRQTVEAAAQVEHAIECVGCAYNKVCPKCPTNRYEDFHSGHCNTAVCEITRKLVEAGVKKLKTENE